MAVAVTPGHGPGSIPRWRHVALALCMFLITGVFGFLQPFVPLYLEAAGLDKGRIGLVTGVGTGLALLIQPLLGRLSDRIDARRPVMCAAAVVAGCAYLGYRSGDGLLAFVLLTALGVNGFLYLNAVGGVLVGRMVATGGARAGAGGATYIRYRIWGSVGYIVIALTTGLLVSRRLATDVLDRAALDPVFTFGPLLFFAIALVALFVPDVPIRSSRLQCRPMARPWRRAPGSPTAAGRTWTGSSSPFSCISSPFTGRRPICRCL
jgi:PPP family 3-phenylpropionic acid transporter